MLLEETTFVNGIHFLFDWTHVLRFLATGIVSSDFLSPVRLLLAFVRFSMLFEYGSYDDGLNSVELRFLVMNNSSQELFSEVGDLKRFSVHYDRSGRSKVLGFVYVSFFRNMCVLYKGCLDWVIFIRELRKLFIHGGEMPWLLSRGITMWSLMESQ